MAGAREACTPMWRIASTEVRAFQRSSGESEVVDASWRSALHALNGDLLRRGLAEKTRRAYAIDCEQFGHWATGRGLDPAAVDVRVLRRYVASMSERGHARSTIARKLAALRCLL